MLAARPPPAAAAAQAGPHRPPRCSCLARVSRRGFTGALLLLAPLLGAAASCAEEGGDGDDEAAVEAAMAAVLSVQKSVTGVSPLSAAIGGKVLSLSLPAAWRAPPPDAAPPERESDPSSVSFGPLVDPVLGPLVDCVVFRAVPSQLPSLAALGAQSDVLPVAAFELTRVAPELARADILRAGSRGGGDTGQPLSYDWELAVPPEFCAYTTGCDSAGVWFVAVTLESGLLCTSALKVSTKEQYKAGADVVRRVRASFSVSDPPPPPPEPEPAAAVEAPQPSAEDLLRSQDAGGAAGDASVRPRSGASPGVVLASP